MKGKKSMDNITVKEYKINYYTVMVYRKASKIVKVEFEKKSNTYPDVEYNVEDNTVVVYYKNKRFEDAKQILKMVNYFQKINIRNLIIKGV